MNFRFPSHEKLKDPQLINYVFENGKKSHYYPLLFLSASLPAGHESILHPPVKHTSKSVRSPLKIGFSVPRRKFRKAVDRNRIKRLMREAYRLQKHTIPSRLKNNMQPTLGVVVIFIGKEIPDYSTVFNAMNRFINQL